METPTLTLSLSVLFKQWINQGGSGTQKYITLTISFTTTGTVVGMDGSVVDIRYASYVYSNSQLKVFTNISGDWWFRAIIIGF